MTGREEELAAPHPARSLSAVDDLKADQLIEIARSTVNDLEAILDRLESFMKTEDKP